MLRVVVRFGSERREFDLPEGEIVLGSSSQSNWHLPFPGVSARHAAVRREGGGIRLRDLGSKNGFDLNGERLDEVVLRRGDRLGLGYVELSLEDVASSDVRVAMSIEDSRPAPARESSSDTESVVPSGAEGSPDRALAHLREIACGRRRGVSEMSRKLLGASSLALVRRSADGEWLLSGLAGSPLESEVFDRLAGAKRSGEGSFLCGRGRVAWASAGETSSGRLVVALDEFDAPLNEWRSSFFLALAGMVGAAGDREGDDAHSDPADESATPLAFPPEMIVGRSPAFQGLVEDLRAAVRSEANVLLLGETGTGKELLARTLHLSSAHSAGEFVAVNCTAIPESIFEAELFGIERHVATSVEKRRGRIAQANGGTLFLDEVAEFPPPLQAKLLRVIQEREVLALGAERAQKIDVTFVAATNRPLAELDSSLRRDLFYRLGGMVLQVPPLRERKEDLPALVLELTRRFSRKLDRRVEGISARALDLLLAHSWPGNVRELENVLQVAVAECPVAGALRADLVEKRLIVLQPGMTGGGQVTRQTAAAEHPSALTIRQSVEGAEREAIVRAIEAADGRIREAAARLQMSERGLRKALLRLGITRGLRTPPTSRF